MSISVKFIGGYSAFERSVECFPQAAYELVVEAATTYLPEDDFCHPQCGISVAVLTTNGGYIPGVPAEGFQFKVAVGCPAVAEAGTLGDFGEYLCKLIRHFVPVKEYLDADFNCSELGQLPIAWPMPTRAALEEAQGYNMAMAMSDVAKFVIAISGQEESNEPFSISHHGWISVKLLNFWKEVGNFRDAITDLDTSGEEKPQQVFLKAVDCVVPGLLDEKSQYFLAISGFDLKANIEEFISILWRLKSEAVPVQYSADVDTLVKATSAISLRELQDLLASESNSEGMIQPPEVSKSSNMTVPEEHFCENELGICKEISVEDLRSDLEDEKPVVRSTISEEERFFLMKRYKVDEETPMDTLDIMKSYEEYIVDGRHLLNPRLATSLMFWSDMTFAEACEWRRKTQAISDESQIIGVALDQMEYEAIMKMSAEHLDAVYKLYEIEFGRQEGNNCTMCPGYLHSGIFCVRYPFLNDRQNLMRASKRCIGCGKNCLIKGYKHDDLSCGQCGLNSHTEYLCNNRFFLTMVNRTVTRIAIMALVTYGWTSDDFQYLFSYLQPLKNATFDEHITREKKKF